MKKIFVLVLIVLLFGGCLTVRLISDYDEVIDKGTVEFYEQFNTHIKNMGDLGGKNEGTYDNNVQKYNALESKLEGLIARASAAAEGKGCKLENKIYLRVKELLEKDTPLEIQPKKDGNSNGCNERLLLLVKKQLNFIQEIHQKTDKCGKNNLSCIRPASASTALKIANQSINAVSIIEKAKKQ